jgi:hypothetical protein
MSDDMQLKVLIIQSQKRKSNYNKSCCSHLKYREFIKCRVGLNYRGSNLRKLILVPKGEPSRKEAKKKKKKRIVSARIKLLLRHFGPFRIIFMTVCFLLSISPSFLTGNLWLFFKYYLDELRASKNL